MPRIVISIPSRGRSQHLPALLEMLAATKSADTAVVVVVNGPERFEHRPLPGVYVVHIGDVPTIPVSVNFGWYALREPGDILVKLDNDMLPSDDWETQILTLYEAIDLGGFICRNETDWTEPIIVRGRRVRAPHFSDSWRIPFVWSGFVWLSPQIAEKLCYEDERFVRSDDGDIAERALRIPGTTIAHCHDSGAIHQARLFHESTEHYELLMSMYEACDALIKVLPARPIAHDTIWRDCLSRSVAARIVLSSGTLPSEVTESARALLRGKLEEAFELVGARDLVRRIFTEM